MTADQDRQERRFLARIFERDDIASKRAESWRMELLAIAALALLVVALVV